MKKTIVVALFIAFGQMFNPLAAQRALPELKPARIAIFKNGTFFIKKEADVAVTNKQVLVPPPNDVLMGTFWVAVGKNTDLRSASVFTDTFSTTRKVVDMDDVLSNNKGKTVTIKRKPFGAGTALREHTGVVIDYLPNSKFLKMQLPDGKLLLTKLADLEEVIADAATTNEIKTSGTRGVTRLTLGQDVARTTVSVMGLEKGMAWVPSYLFRVVNEKEARLEMKATIVNDGAGLKQLPVDLVVGNPALFYGMQLDPVCGDYLEDLLDGKFDNDKLSNTFSLNVSNGVVQRSGPASFNRTTSDEETTTDGEKTQDLYYFKLGVMDIEENSKTIVPVFSQNIAYKDVYEISIPAATLDGYYKSSLYQDESPLEVYHSFRFSNNTKTPFTTGPVFVLDEKENPLAQDELKYTPSGAESVIRLSKAIDVSAKNEEEVTDMVDNFKKLNKVSYNKASLKGKIKLANYQQKKIKISITKTVVGETGALSHNGTSVKLKLNGNVLNPTSRITWEVELNPGEQQTVSYEYSILVN
ncbi:MAG: hypothetical protein JNM68_09565 [Dinghuibacter sp.]|nr:hypothetical protein [Dinghuibacter sp.]